MVNAATKNGHIACKIAQWRSEGAKERRNEKGQHANLTPLRERGG